MRWDPGQYARFADDRLRPFHDLLARVGAVAPRRVVDLGCGPGNLTAVLAERWPAADVTGIDSSAEMIDAARAVPTLARFVLGDVTSWLPRPGDDVFVSNAVLQWVPGHGELLARWATAVPGGGWLAVQVPGNFGAPAHTLLREFATSPRWAPSVGDVLRHHDTVGSPSSYAGLLLDAGLEVDAWETTYVHVLAGADPVLDWLRGTGLRPVLAVLSPADGARFCAELAELLRAAYPVTGHGTMFPFRRIFAVGHRR